ncbi:MAG: hypothetical protein R3F21_03760 [Myxococcota bacterium]
MGARRRTSAFRFPEAAAAAAAVFAFVAIAVGCASPATQSGATEPVLFEGFAVRVPVGPDWVRQREGSTLVVGRALGEAWSHGMVVEITVPPPLPDPVHPYDLLASARVNAANLAREAQIDLVDHGERLVEHQGMDCVDFYFMLARRHEVDGETRHSAQLGRGLVCRHPRDARRIVNLRYAVENHDGRLMAVDQALGDAFLDSIRPQPVADHDASAAPARPETSDSTSDQRASRSAAASRVQGSR